MPQRRCWSGKHALEVARKLKETGWSQTKLADYFRKSRPTIRRALKLAEKSLLDDSAPEDAPARSDAETA